MALAGPGQFLAPTLASSSSCHHHHIRRSHGGPEVKRPTSWYCRALILSASARGFIGSLKSHACRKPATLLTASGRMELLVDADTHSIDFITQSIADLEAHCGQKVSTTLFAPPERCHNRKWAAFMQDHYISFRSVQRGSNVLTEPNDEAIIREMQKLSNKGARMALLTGDTDYIDTLLTLRAEGSNIMVLIPEGRLSTIWEYERQGLKVLSVTPLKRPSTRVRAILQEDGTGSVKLSGPYNSPSGDVYLPASVAVQEFLRGLGYRGTSHMSLGQTCGKFWFENQLGTLTVFPIPSAVMTVHRVLAESAMPRSWQGSSGDLAFFLPTTAMSRLSKNDQTYGDRRARAVFRGGGPFMLNDSSELVVQALHRLGFLDNCLNTDVGEAMFLFINLTENKNYLRKHGLLPCAEENSADVEKKLRAAFLSNEIPGMWQIMNNSPAAMCPILYILRKSKIISKKTEDQYSREEIFRSMKLYAKQHRLPAMRSFHGMVWMVLHHNQPKNPNKRPVVEFLR